MGVNLGSRNWRHLALGPVNSVQLNSIRVYSEVNDTERLRDEKNTRQMFGQSSSQTKVKNTQGYAAGVPDKKKLKVMVKISQTVLSHRIHRNKNRRMHCQSSTITFSPC
eukprot:187701-Amphidinium_carterae.1